MNTLFGLIVSEFDSADHEAEYNAWFKAKIEKSMVDTRPTVPHDQVVARLKNVVSSEQRMLVVEFSVCDRRFGNDYWLYRCT
jgi:hypothetical protein